MYFFNLTHHCAGSHCYCCHSLPVALFLDKAADDLSTLVRCELLISASLSIFFFSLMYSCKYGRILDMSKKKNLNIKACIVNVALEEALTTADCSQQHFESLLVLTGHVVCLVRKRMLLNSQRNGFVTFPDCRPLATHCFPYTVLSDFLFPPAYLTSECVIYRPWHAYWANLLERVEHLFYPKCSALLPW